MTRKDTKAWIWGGLVGGAIFAGLMWFRRKKDIPVISPVQVKFDDGLNDYR